MRITLPSLTPSTSYILKVRSKVGADVGEWSRNFYFTTYGDLVAPAKPANVVGSMSGTSFKLSWDQVLLSTDSSAANDMDHYDVLVSSTGTATTGVYRVTDTKFEFSLEMNTTLFGSPRANVQMAVRSVDAVGNTDGYTTAVSQTNAAPSVPANFTGVAGTGLITFKWDAVSDLDLKQYRIYMGTSSGATNTLLWSGPATGATIQISDTVTDRWWRVVSVDVFGTESANSTILGPLKPLALVAVDTTAPAIPAGLAATLTNATNGVYAQAAISWTAVTDTDNDLDSYIIGYKPSADSDWDYVTVDYTNTTALLKNLLPYTNYDFRIRSSDFSANLSNWSSTLTKTATTNAAPATVTGVTAVAGKDSLTASWTENTEPDVAGGAGTYMVDIARDSGFTTGLLSYKTGATNITFSALLQSQIYYVRVKAVDSLGLASAAWSTSANATTGSFASTSLSDGLVPTNVPTVTLTGGIGYLLASWTPIANADPVTYEVFMSTTTGFTTYDATTKVGEVDGSSIFIRKTAGGTDVAYGTTYYVKVRPRDRDGVGTVSAQASATPIKAASSDITSMSVAQLTAGSFSAGAITLAPGGSIVTTTGGVSLTDSGIIIPSGYLDANVLKANTSFITTLNIGAGGVIQSTGYTGGGTSGFQLSQTGLTIKGTNNVVAVEAVAAGTISAKTINIGATGVLNVDSTGVIKSNNYAANTTGYQLSNTGLEVNDGSIDAKALRTNTAIIGDLTVGRTADALGSIKSFGYVANTTGFKLDKTGLEINSGLISAAALLIQDSQNLILPQFASFDFPSSFYLNALNMYQGTSAAVLTVPTSGGKYGLQYLQVRSNSATALNLYFGPDASTYNHQLEFGETYIYSAWLKTGAVASTVRLRIKNSAGTTTDVATVNLPANGAWQRVSGTYTPTVNNSVVPMVSVDTATTGAGVDIDGVQIERKMGAITTASPWRPPSSTTINGGAIQTGEIRSSATMTVNGIVQPSWFINMAGGAQLGDVAVRGRMIVGEATGLDASESFISSGNYIEGTSGWRIDSSGDVEFNSGTFRGPIAASQIQTGTMTADVSIAGRFKTADAGKRTEIDGTGIRQYGTDGISVIVDLPNDDGQIARFTGIINTTGITVNDGLELRGMNNLYSMASVTTLASNISGSSTPPSLSSDWERFDANITVGGYATLGFHAETDGGTRWCVSNVFGYARINSPTGLYDFPAVTDASGNGRSTYSISGCTVINTGSAQRLITVGDKVPTNGAAPTWVIRSYDTSTLVGGGTVAPIQKVEINAPYQVNYVYTRLGRVFSPVGTFALENNFVLAEFNQYVSPKTVKLYRYAVTDSAITQQGSTITITSPFVGTENLIGVAYGSSLKMGFPGTDQNIWLVMGETNTYAYNSTGTTRITNFDFPMPPGTKNVDATGSTVAGQNEFLGFRSAATTNQGGNVYVPVYKHTNIHWISSDSSVWWAGYTWADTDAGGTGSHETEVSALSSITMKKRQRLTITTPGLPDPVTGQGTPRGTDDVNAFRVYMQRQATKPTRTALWKQSVQPADLATSLTVSTMPEWTGTTNPPLVTNFPGQSPAIIKSSALGADGLPKFLLNGDGLLHAESLDVSGGGATSFSGKAFDQLMYGIRAQARIFGGGTMSVTASNEVSWSSRFIVISLGRGPNIATNGFFEMTMPAVGTVIPGYGSAGNKTVTSGGIPLGSWQALYYQLPYGSTNTSIAANYRVVDYQTTDFTVPNDWILVCIRQADASLFEFAGGQRVKPTTAYYMPDDWIAPTLGNSWANYGLGYTNCAYRRTAEGRVLLRGLIKSGTNSTVFTLPAGYRPIGAEYFVVGASTGLGDVRVTAAGAVNVNGYYSGGTNGFLSLNQVSFDVY